MLSLSKSAETIDLTISDDDSSFDDVPSRFRSFNRKRKPLNFEVRTPVKRSKYIDLFEAIDTEVKKLQSIEKK